MLLMTWRALSVSPYHYVGVLLRGGVQMFQLFSVQ